MPCVETCKQKHKNERGVIDSKNAYLTTNCVSFIFNKVVHVKLSLFFFLLEFLDQIIICII